MRKITDLAQTVSGLIIRRHHSFFRAEEGNKIHFNYPPALFFGAG